MASFVEVQPEIHEDESVQPNLGTREELPRRLRLIAAPMVVLRWLAVAVGALVWLLVVPLVDLFGGLARRLTRRKPL